MAAMVSQTQHPSVVCLCVTSEITTRLSASTVGNSGPALGMAVEPGVGPSIGQDAMKPFCFAGSVRPGAAVFNVVGRVADGAGELARSVVVQHFRR